MGTQQSGKYSSNTESTHLVETEFKILQSLIPGISDQNEVSELEIIDACVQYIETLQNQLEDHLVQNPHLNKQYHDSIIGNNNKIGSSELLDRLAHGHRNSTYDTTTLETTRCVQESYQSTTTNPEIILSTTSRTNLPKHVQKKTGKNQADESIANPSNHK